MIKYLFIILLLISGQALAQQDPDVVVNAESPQGSTVENQNFANLYQAQSQTASTVSAINGYYANGVLSAANGGTGQNSSQWPTGDIVYMSSTGTWGHESSPPWTPNNIQVFTSSGTWNNPGNITKVYLKIWGAGGGGGTGGTSTAAGGGGGGEYTETYDFVSGSVSVTVGAGGAASTGGGNGGTGGTSSFAGNITMSAIGGSGGLDGAGGAGGIGGTGGTNTGGYSFPGTQGGFTYSTSPAGRSGIQGQGGLPGQATGYAGPGSGGPGSTMSEAASPGSSGMVIVYY